jgi:hypothetical protein
VVRDEWRSWNAAAFPDQLREQADENLAAGRITLAAEDVAALDKLDRLA